METIVVFDPSIEELQKIVAETSKITAEDLSDDTQMVIVHDTRIKLRDIRIRIEKTGKTLRQSALDFQRNVIAREKELLSVVGDEEVRLKTLEDTANSIKERNARISLLPMRKAELAKLGLEVTDDNQILDLDNDAFVALLNDLQAKKNAADAAELAEMKTKMLRDAELKQAAEEAATRERARIEAAQKADEQRRIDEAAIEKMNAGLAAQKLIDDAKTEAARVLKEAEDKEADRLEVIRVNEENARIYKEKQDADVSFQAWKVQIGYKPEESDKWILQEDNGTTRAFKLYASFVR